ncbi:hypothetical protein [Streptomyces sp. NPDC050534]
MYEDIILSLVARSEQCPHLTVVCLVVIWVWVRRRAIRPHCAAC